MPDGTGSCNRKKLSSCAHAVEIWLIQSHPEDLLEVEVSSPAVLKDMDNPEDYAAIIPKKLH